MSVQVSFERGFATALQQLAAPPSGEPDRAALAALRRGLGRRPGEIAEPYRVLLTLPDARPAPWQEDACFLVAGLFAWHLIPWRESTDGPTNLGESLRRHANARPGNGAERRFVALLNAGYEDLPVHLRHVVGLLRASETPIDYAQLLRDVTDRAWNAESRYVQRAWSRAFWRQPAAAAPSESADAPAS
jgi:CRISPR system Cascade subunit CasB